MKKLFLSLILLVVLMFPIQSWGKGTVTQTLSYSHNFYTLIYSWTGDVSNGSVPATASTWPIGGYIVKVITNPGATAPTDNYDITLTNSDGIDVVHGELTNRDTTNSEEIVPVPSDNVTVYGGSAVSGVITLNITNNSVNSATGTVTVIFERAGY